MSQGNPLYWLRELRKDTVQREARGEKLWTEQLDDRVRNKLGYAVADLRLGAVNYEKNLANMLEIVTRQLGLPPDKFNYGEYYRPSECIFDSITNSFNNESLIFSLVEGIYQGISNTHRSSVNAVQKEFVEKIRAILEDHRIAYDFIQGRVVPRGEQEMHVEVVVPAITLLSGRSDFEDAERNYMDALESIQENRFDDAVTNAASAVEVTLRILGCGNAHATFEKRGAVAIEKNLLASHDKKLLGWVTATRGSEGDAHGRGSHTSRADAWLLVHVAGALILRLVDGPNRGIES